MLIKIGREARPTLVTLKGAEPMETDTTMLFIEEGHATSSPIVGLPFNTVAQLIHDCQKGGAMVDLTAENCARLNPPASAPNVKKNFNGPAT